MKTFKVIREVLQYFKRRNEFKALNKHLPKNYKFNWNMIKEDCTKVEYMKQFTVFHQRFKYKFIVPVIIISQKLLGKYLIKKLPDRKYNEQFQAMDNAFEQSIKDMIYLQYQYLENIKKKEVKDVDNEALDKLVKEHHTAKNLRTIKEIIFTVIQNDTYYRNFGTLLLYNIYKELHEFFGKNKSIMLYSSKDINDLKFQIAVGHNIDTVVIEGNKETLIVPKANAIILKDFGYNKEKK